jgi:hypothetical protein
MFTDFCESSMGERKTGKQAKHNLPEAVKCLRFREIVFSGSEVFSLGSQS